MNVVLFVLKYWAGIVSGSIALITDAWHTLSDSITSIAVMVGFKLSKKPADQEHPFGHGRIELISSVFIGIFLAFIGVSFFSKSIEKLVDQQSANFGTLAIVVTIISIVGKEGIAQYALWASKKAESQSLRADGWHHRTDAFSSLIILIGIFFSSQYWWIDGVLGIIVAAMILYAAFDIFKNTVSSLIGDSPEEDLLKQINEVIDCSVEDNVYPHHFHLHKYGDHKELTFHIKLPGNTQLYDVHKIVQQLERSIRKNLKINPTIKVDALKEEDKQDILDY